MTDQLYGTILRIYTDNRQYNDSASARAATACSWLNSYMSASPDRTRVPVTILRENPPASADGRLSPGHTLVKVTRDLIELDYTLAARVTPLRVYLRCRDVSLVVSGDKPNTLVLTLIGGILWTSHLPCALDGHPETIAMYLRDYPPPSDFEPCLDVPPVLTATSLTLQHPPVAVVTHLAELLTSYNTLAKAFGLPPAKVESSDPLRATATDAPIVTQLSEPDDERTPTLLKELLRRCDLHQGCRVLSSDGSVYAECKTRPDSYHRFEIAQVPDTDKWAVRVYYPKDLMTIYPTDIVRLNSEGSYPAGFDIVLSDRLIDHFKPSTDLSMGMKAWYRGQP